MPSLLVFSNCISCATRLLIGPSKMTKCLPFTANFGVIPGGSSAIFNATLEPSEGISTPDNWGTNGTKLDSNSGYCVVIETMASITTLPSAIVAKSMS